MKTRPTNKQIYLWMHEKFTRKQLEIYSLVHPDIGGMSIKEAANRLGITIHSARYRLDRMEEIYPDAFRFRDMLTEEQTQISNSYKKEGEMSRLTKIMSRTKQLAKKYKVPFELDEEQFLEIIRSECFVCGKDGVKDGITEDGRHFKYNMILLRCFSIGFNYTNSYTVCNNCYNNQSWRNLQRYKRMGF
jgi:transposase